MTSMKPLSRQIMGAMLACCSSVCLRSRTRECCCLVGGPRLEVNLHSSKGGVNGKTGPRFASLHMATFLKVFNHECPHLLRGEAKAAVHASMIMGHEGSRRHSSTSL